MKRTLIFNQFIIENGKINLQYYDTVYNKTGSLFFNLLPAILPSYDLIALSLSTLCGYNKYDIITIDLPITKIIKQRIENFTNAKLISLTNTNQSSYPSNGKNLILNFSGGFDSLAAKYLMPNNTKLVFMNLGGMFAREEKMVQEFSHHQVQTNLIDTHFRKNSWTFMGIAAILFHDYLNAKYITFGNIIEATPMNVFNIQSVSKNTTPSCFEAANMNNAPYVLGLSEIGTALVVMRSNKDIIYPSLNSLANDGEIKKYRKQLIIHILNQKFNMNLPIETFSLPEIKITFGQRFADDFLCFYFLKNCDVELVKQLFENIPESVITLTKQLSLNFYEKFHTQFLEYFPIELKDDLLNQLTKLNIELYNENDFYEFNLVSQELMRFYPPSIQQPDEKVDKIMNAKNEKYLTMRNKEFSPPWKIEKIGNFYQSITPNKIELQLSNQINTLLNPPQYQSTMLWYHSLSWLKVIVNEYQDFEFANQVIDSYYKFIISDESETILQSLTSRDHLVAEQIRTLTFLLAHAQFTSKQQAEVILSQLINWALLPNNIHNNNHGMMLAVSLLHTPLFIDIKISEFITPKILEIIKSAFDSQGLCNENTPAYHNFYIQYIKQIIGELGELNVITDENINYSNLINELKQILQIAEKTLSVVVLPNGALPPFGDGILSKEKLTSPLEYAEFFSQESGFYVFKHKKLKPRYFAMKCGFSSITHKHCDDTAIFYWYDGMPIITDAGFLNYDWEDPKNILVKSQRGHSGAFFKKFDVYYPGALYRPKNDTKKKNRVFSSMEMNVEENLRNITGKVSIDEHYHIQRQIKFSHLNNILITDTFSSKEKNSEKCVRFLIPKEHHVAIEENVILISNVNFELTLKFTTGQVSIRKGVMENNIPAIGWLAEKQFSDLVECWVIEINLPPNINRTTTNLILTEKS